MEEQYEQTGLIKELGITFTCVEPHRVEGVMPIGPHVLQSHGFVHGGATLALLESVASLGSCNLCDLETELPFGVEVNVRHRKSGVAGHVRAVAAFDREEPNRGKAGGVKQYWNVAAYDDAGDVMSDGYVMMKVVPRANLPQQNS